MSSEFEPKIPRVYQMPTFFHTPDKENWYVEERGAFPLAIGAGVLGGQGDFYRVRDVWFSLDRHGHFDTGFHVFLEPAEIDREMVSADARRYFQLEAPPGSP